jgi:glycosyltransferase involved in cell wall biosynthesis
VAIGWHGLPAYAARAIRRTTARFDVPLQVIGSPGVESRAAIESIIGGKVTWISPRERVGWSDLGLDPPAIFFYTGWAYKGFNSLALETKRSGGCTVCMTDNSRKFTLRQALGKWYFRAAIRPKIDKFLVPGDAAQTLMDYFGVPAGKIHRGLYGADCQVFPPGPPLSERTNDFVFVGQFIPRKGIGCLIQATSILKKSGKRFSFVAIGQGPLRQDLEDAGFRVEQFSAPEVVAERLRNSRFLVLPSSEDHWPLVVHEAALSGCGLILSEAVGSRFEFSGKQNSWRFNTGDSTALAETMALALELDEYGRVGCYAQSLALAGKFGPDRWNESFRDILELCAVNVPEHTATNGRSEKVR